MSLFNLFNNFDLNIWKKEKNIIIDPLSCLIKLSILSLYPEGTKICISNNSISYCNPNVLQGSIRFINGDAREDLHNLFKPIQKSIEWFSNEPKYNDKINVLYKMCQRGLTKLKKCYEPNSTIQHSIDYYISYINENLNENINENINENLNENLNETLNETLNENLNENINENLNENKYHATTDNTNNTDNIDNTDNTTRDNVEGAFIKNNNKKEKKNNNNDNNDDNHNINPNKKNKKNKTNNIIYEFIKNLWSEREINIVIQLFEEYKVKTNEEEKENILLTISNLTSIKEKLLNKFLKEQSSIL